MSDTQPVISATFPFNPDVNPMDDNARLQQALEWQWKPTIVEFPEGDFSLTVPPVDDFEMFSDSREELEAEWRDAFKGHMRAYIAVGLPLPVPYLEMVTGETSTAGDWEPSEQHRDAE